MDENLIYEILRRLKIKEPYSTWEIYKEVTQDDTYENFRVSVLQYINNKYVQSVDENPFNQKLTVSGNNYLINHESKQYKEELELKNLKEAIKAQKFNKISMIINAILTFISILAALYIGDKLF